MTSDRDSKEVQVPVFLTGIVTKTAEPDFCMDGADFRLHTLSGVVRVKPTNDETAKHLGGYAGKRLRVTVGGYPVMGPECTHLAAYYVAPASELNETIRRATHENAAAKTLTVDAAIAGCKSIDSTSNDNGFLNCARSKNPGAGAHGSTAEAVQRLLACMGAARNACSLVGHGNDGIIVTGQGQHPTDAAKFITTWNRGVWGPQLAELKGRATNLALWGCHPGTGDAGADLLYQVAQVINAPAQGPTGFLYCSASRPDLTLEPGSTWQVATPTVRPHPIPAPSHHLGVEVMTMVLDEKGTLRSIPLTQVVAAEYTDARHQTTTFKLGAAEAKALLAQVHFEDPKSLGVPAAIPTGTLVVHFDDQSQREEREFTIYNNRLLQDAKSPEVTYHVAPGFTSAIMSMR